MQTFDCQVGDLIHINGNQITIEICHIRTKQVKLKLDAPWYVKIFRQEVYDSVKKEQEGRLPS